MFVNAKFSSSFSLYQKTVKKEYVVIINSSEKVTITLIKEVQIALVKKKQNYMKEEIGKSDSRRNNSS